MIKLTIGKEIPSIHLELGTRRDGINEIAMTKQLSELRHESKSSSLPRPRQSIFTIREGRFSLP